MESDMYPSPSQSVRVLLEIVEMLSASVSTIFCHFTPSRTYRAGDLSELVFPSQARCVKNMGSLLERGIQGVSSDSSSPITCRNVDFTTTMDFLLPFCRVTKISAKPRPVLSTSLRLLTCPQLSFSAAIGKTPLDIMADFTPAFMTPPHKTIQQLLT
jgi:hypothetical protein